MAAQWGDEKEKSDYGESTSCCCDFQFIKFVLECIKNPLGGFVWHLNHICSSVWWMKICISVFSLFIRVGHIDLSYTNIINVKESWRASEYIDNWSRCHCVVLVFKDLPFNFLRFFASSLYSDYRLQSKADVSLCNLWRMKVWALLCSYFIWGVQVSI